MNKQQMVVNYRSSSWSKTNYFTVTEPANLSLPNYIHAFRLFSSWNLVPSIPSPSSVSSSSTSSSASSNSTRLTTTTNRDSNVSTKRRRSSSLEEEAESTRKQAKRRRKTLMLDPSTITN